MSALKNKTILILSPQSWGKMFVSKHHYAVELAKRGNTVYFLNPPDQGGPLTSLIDIEKSEKYPGLFIISHRLSFPYNLKFHLMPLFHFFMKGHIKKIIKSLDRVPDIIWSFDLGNLYPFRLFPNKASKIFHPVDEPLNNVAIDAGKGADLIFSVTHEILEKYKKYKVPAVFVNHGVSDIFLQRDCPKIHESETLHVGFSGNLLRPDLDRPIMIKIVHENPGIIFECWGSYEIGQTNIAGSDDLETKKFIETLKASPNVKLHGPVGVFDLAQEFRRMDLFLICYDVELDQSRGTNYHKVMEYLSTGKVIVSNNITTYKDNPELIQMVKERDNNDKLPGLFAEVVSNIGKHNTDTLQKLRYEFAIKNAYSEQLKIIESVLNG